MSHLGVLPRLDLAIFADTGWEPATVYAHLEWLRRESSIPIVTVSNGRNLHNDVRNWEQQEGQRKMVIPVFTLNEDGTHGMVQHRQCTDKYKIVPIRKYIREQVIGLNPGQRGPSMPVVEQWLGISADEATRMRESRDRYIRLAYPLVDMNMSRSDCLAWFSERYPGISLPRSACSGCPFRSDKEWLEVRNTNPDDFEAAAVTDDKIRRDAVEIGFKGKPFLHSRRKPLRESVDEYEAELKANPMLPGLESGSENDCSGVCFV